MLKKQYLKTRAVCKVTFRISKSAAQSALEIALIGDFNHWQRHPMTALKNGEFTTVLELDTGKTEYQFRYVYDDSRWENDWEADGYVSNGIDGENGILRI